VLIAGLVWFTLGLSAAAALVRGGVITWLTVGLFAGVSLSGSV
jgi:hypothetical protein